jgi:3-dehydroquinate synthase
VTTTRITVDGAAPYDVVIGPGLAAELPPLVSGASTVVVLADMVVAERGERLADELRNAGHRVDIMPIADGEQAKSLDALAGMWDRFGALTMTRSDAIVAVGGGATTDVVGFAAATWLRGVRVVHVPTTLLGMVDAAVGGKTAINTSAGKNLVGAFHPPAGVLVDLDVLQTLPAAQWVNGMAEVVKAGFIADPAILDLIADDPGGAARPDGPHARELIERSIAMKADVVSRDLREASLREILNYGHTLGHAIEQAEHYQLPHGHCVSIGMIFAAAIGRRSGRLDDSTADQHRLVLEQLGLPTSYRAAALPELLDLMRIDKKSRGDLLRLVVLDGLGKPGMLEGPSSELLEAAYQEVAG